MARPLDGDDDATVRCDVGAVERLLFPGALAITLDQPSYSPGDTLPLDVTVGNPGPAAPVDAYLGVNAARGRSGRRLSRGRRDRLLHPGPRGRGGPVRVGPAERLSSLRDGVVVPAGLPPTIVDDLLAAIVPPGVPAGAYLFFLALLVPNALLDDVLDGGDVQAADPAAAAFE